MKNRKTQLLASDGPVKGLKKYEDEVKDKVEELVKKSTDLARTCHCWDMTKTSGDRTAPCPKVALKLPVDPLELEFNKEFDWGDWGKNSAKAYADGVAKFTGKDGSG